MATNKHVDHYINLYKQGKVKFNEERKLLMKYLKEKVLNRSDVWFEEVHIEQCIQFIEKYYFPLADFQKFLIAFMFLMTLEEDETALFFDSFLITMARGAGKNGLLSGIIHYFISPLYDVEEYNVSLVANSEEQAQRSFGDVYDVLKKEAERDPLMKDYFYWNKVEIIGLLNNSKLSYRTSSPRSQDSLRDGLVAFDEFHAYRTNEQIEVHESGLGKTLFPRIFYIGTNGFERDGVYDKKIEIAKSILSGEDEHSRMFPWICKLDDIEEVHDFEQWEKANPMFSYPRTQYAKTLFVKKKRRYHGIKTGQTDLVKFMIKDMNTLMEDTVRTAVPREELIAATRDIPEDTSSFTCIGACDFAQARDFTACGVLFMDNNGEYIWKHHSFVNGNFLKEFDVKAPIEEWERQGLLTIVNEPLIGVEHIVNWFVDMREKNPSLQTIVLDLFKLNALKVPLEEQGFEVLYIRNPKAISGQVSDTIDRVFASKTIRWGDDFMMRWYTNNVYVTYDSSGNKVYEKKEEVRRKTDGFMALVYAFYYANNNLSTPSEFYLDQITY